MRVAELHGTILHRPDLDCERNVSPRDGLDARFTDVYDDTMLWSLLA